MPAGTEVNPDKDSLKKAEVGGDFLPPEPKEPDLALEGQKPEDVKGDADKIGVSKTQRPENKAALEAAAAKRLTGDSSNVGQGQLLAGDEDLFSGKSAETQAKEAEKPKGVADRIIASLQAAKLHGNGKTTAATPLSLAYDGARSIAAIFAVKASRFAVDAVRVAINHLKTRFPDVDQKEIDKLRAAIEEAHKAENPPAEFPKPAGETQSAPEDTSTSIKNAVVDRERAKRGLEPAMAVAKRDFGTVWDEAMRTIDHNPDAGKELVAELEGPRTSPDRH